MVAWNRGGRSGLGGVVATVVLAVGVLACATTVTEEGGVDPATDAISSTEPGGISDVLVEKKGDTSVVTLVGLEDPVYTAFLHQDPAALVLDIASVPVSNAENPVVVYDGLVEQVSVASFDAGADSSMTRVEVTLAEAAEYEIATGPNGLELRVWSAGTELSEADENDPWAEVPTESISVEGTVEDVAASEPTPPAPPAHVLSDVAVSQTSAGVLIHLEADGVIGAMETFTLEDPARLVVDLPGLASKMEKGTVEVGADWVSRIRVGGHSDKVRVVIDGGPAVGAFEGRRVMPSADGLYITLGSGDDLDEALMARVEAATTATTTSSVAAVTDGPIPLTDDEAVAMGDAELAEAEVASIDPDDAMDPAAANAEANAAAELTVAQAGLTRAESSIASVHGIHFDSQADRDRIVVLSEGLVEWKVHTPDSETLVVSIPGASIPREAEGRITPPLGGPVSLVTAFAQPDVSGGEVRIVVKRAADLEPEINRHGSLIFIDFPNTGVAAAPPPAFADEMTTVATTGSPAAPAASSTDDMGDPAVFEALDGGLEAAKSIDGVAAIEIVDDDSFNRLPQFEGGQLAAIEDGLADLPGDNGLVGPASLEPPASVDLLEEGGLIDGKEYRGRRISLDFKDVQIADVLRIIAEVSDLNVVAGEEVAGTVTIRLVDVPWDQALDVILLTKGLGFVRVGSVLRIAPAEIIAQEEEVRLQERRNKEKLEDLVVKLQPVNYADVNDVSDLIRKVLSARGSVNVDERTNTLILKDIASVVDEASALIMAVDTQTPQVMIEAKIVEANLDFSRELGSVWAFGANPFKDGFDPNQGPRTDLGDKDFLFHDNNNVIFANPITSLASGLATMNAFILDEKFNLSVSLAAAESTGDGKVISSPRIVTLDNREAEIEQGVSIPFQTFENGDAKLEFIDAVLRLGVTPHISSDKSIVMQIEVTRNAPDDSVQTPTGSPAIAKNEANTETLVKDGQTLVIGGIYTVVQSTRESRVPYLHKIPIIGNAFKSKEVTDQRKELLIFVTPRIVTLPDAG